MVPTSPSLTFLLPITHILVLGRNFEHDRACTDVLSRHSSQCIRTFFEIQKTYETKAFALARFLVPHHLAHRNRVVFGSKRTVQRHIIDLRTKVAYKNTEIVFRPRICSFRFIFRIAQWFAENVTALVAGRAHLSIGAFVPVRCILRHGLIVRLIVRFHKGGSG